MVVIVVCRDVKTAEWARKPYLIGLPHQPTLVSTPIVVGPDNLPRITDSAQVIADPYAAVLCALAYAHDPEADGILESIASALPELGDEQTSKFLMDYIDRGLQGTAAQEIWRKTLSIIPITGTYRSEMAMESRAEGRVEGTTTSVLQILNSRGIIVSPAARAHITACTDVELATTWVREALTVAGTDELIGLSEGRSVLIEAILYTKPDIGSRAEARLEGMIAGYTEAVLRVLECRGIAVSPATRARIIERADFNTAQVWLEEFFNVTSAEQLSGIADEAYPEG